MLRNCSVADTPSNVSSVRQRGRCPICNYSVTIRRNGYAERHYLYATEKFACPGGEEMRREGDVPSVPLARWLGGRDSA